LLLLVPLLLIAPGIAPPRDAEEEGVSLWFGPTTEAEASSSRADHAMRPVDAALLLADQTEDEPELRADEKGTGCCCCC